MRSPSASSSQEAAATTPVPHNLHVRSSTPSVVTGSAATLLCPDDSEGGRLRPGPVVRAGDSSRPPPSTWGGARKWGEGRRGGARSPPRPLAAWKEEGETANFGLQRRRGHPAEDAGSPAWPTHGEDARSCRCETARGSRQLPLNVGHGARAPRAPRPPQRQGSTFHASPERPRKLQGQPANGAGNPQETSKGTSWQIA